MGTTHSGQARIGLRSRRTKHPAPKAQPKTPVPSLTNTTRECIICTSTFLESNMHQLSCRHWHCSNCVRHNVQNAMNTQPFRPARCCVALDLRIVRALLPSKLSAYYAWLVDEFDDPARMYCHRDGCGTFIPTAKRSKRVGVCPRCGNRTCKLCGRRSHWGPCRGQEDQRQEKTTDETKLLALAKKYMWQRCPRCRYLVERVAGCNTIV